MNYLSKMAMFLAVIFFVIGQSDGQERAPEQKVQYSLSDETIMSPPQLSPAAADSSLGCSTCRFQGYAQWSNANVNYGQTCQSCQGTCGCQGTCQSHCGHFFGRCSGCANCCPAPSFARPFGESVNCAMNCQVQNGVTAQLVFYVNDFYPHPNTNTWELTESGVRNFEKIVCLLPLSPCPVIVQSTHDLSQDELRRQKIVELMMARGTVISPDRIIVGRPRVSGISGVEAQMIYARSLETRQLKDLETPDLGSFGPGLNSGGDSGNGPSR